MAGGDLKVPPPGSRGRRPSASVRLRRAGEFAGRFASEVRGFVESEPPGVVSPGSWADEAVFVQLAELVAFALTAGHDTWGYEQVAEAAAQYLAQVCPVSVVAGLMERQDAVNRPPGKEQGKKAGKGKAGGKVRPTGRRSPAGAVALILALAVIVTMAALVLH